MVVLSSIPVGACACGAEGHMASIGPLALGAKGCVERLRPTGAMSIIMFLSDVKPLPAASAGNFSRMVSCTPWSRCVSCQQETFCEWFPVRLEAAVFQLDRKLLGTGDFSTSLEMTGAAWGRFVPPQQETFYTKKSRRP